MQINRSIIVGFNEIKKHKWKIIVLFVYAMFVAKVGSIGAEYIKKINTIKMYRYIFIIFMLEVFALGIMLILMRLGGDSPSCRRLEKDLLENKFIDKKGNPPVVLSKKKEKQGIIFEFYSSGIPISEYERQCGLLEVVLGVKIISITMGKNVRCVTIKGITNQGEIQQKMIWKNTFLDDKDFILKVGENNFGEEYIDLSFLPHVLIGGSTGSGKSNLVKVLAFQSLKKGADVYIGDFKGGIDYVGKWREKCKIIIDEQEFYQMLLKIIQIMEKRRTIFYEAKVSKIEEYNQKMCNENSMKRIVIICDEFAEILDKKDKEKKDLHSKIELILIKISSQARAYGIHLIMATQRPDSDILDGKIKGNLGYRICGRADSVLSKIIIDNVDASKLISEEDVGIFVTNMKTFFKAYYLEDNCWEEE